MTYTGKEIRDRGLSESLRSSAKHNDVWFQIIECVGDGKTAHMFGKRRVCTRKEE